MHDNYKAIGKLPEPSVCPQCGAVYYQGSWQWLKAPDGAHAATCPACHRIHDHFPAGFIRLSVHFFRDHQEELIGLLYKLEQHDKSQFPLKRIMGIEELENDVLITTTDIHLARSISDALHHAYQLNFAYHYNQEKNLLRVEWMQ